MWKRVNPNVEYVIAAMRKKGEDIKNGISKVRCQRKATAAKESAIAASVMRSLIGPKPNNLVQPGMTSLCGDKPLRGSEVYEEAENDDYERKANRGNWRHSILALLRYVQNKAWKY